MSLRDTREHENADDGSKRISRLQLFSREDTKHRNSWTKKTAGQTGLTLVDDQSLSGYKRLEPRGYHRHLRNDSLQLEVLPAPR